MIYIYVYIYIYICIIYIYIYIYGEAVIRRGWGLNVPFVLTIRPKTAKSAAGAVPAA